MSARMPPAAPLLSADQALTAYLDGLLAEVPPDTAVPEPVFDALIVDVSGLRVAVRADAVVRVMAFHADRLRPALTPRPYVLGTVDGADGPLTVCDTAALIIPPGAVGGVTEPPRRLLVIHGTGWALACGPVVGMLTLSPHQVRWRSDAGRRGWLAGTVMAHACALLDVAALLGLAGEGI